MSQQRTPVCVAGSRESGGRCPACQKHIHQGDAVAVCARCGTVHHEPCWQAHLGCSTYECAPATRDLSHAAPVTRIDFDEINTAPVLAAPVPRSPRRRQPEAPRRFSRAVVVGGVVLLFALVMAIADLGTGRGWLLGAMGAAVLALIPLLLGLSAVAAAKRRGTLVGVVGVLLSLGLLAGGGVLLALKAGGGLGGPREFHRLEMSSQPDLERLESGDPAINRSMRANVVIRSTVGLGEMVGSGVIVRHRAGHAYVLTNRHVVDAEYVTRGDYHVDPSTLSVDVQMIGQPFLTGKVLWIAPDDVDLAVVSVPLHSQETRAIPVTGNNPVRIGDEVYAIGNPQGLAWTYAQGKVSQFRSQGAIRVIQTSTQLNPGNSGGGLYARDGTLVGIVTWKLDLKSEGLNLAIDTDSVAQLLPAEYRGAGE